MYGSKFVIVLCVAGVVSAYHSNNNDNLRKIDSIHVEPECSSQGGICTIAADCPSGKLVEPRGLCPKQRSEGVECCYGVSEKETRCQKRGGGCMEGCNSSLIDYHATDCPKDSKCCTLLSK